MPLLRFQYLLFFLFVFPFESLTAQFDPHAGIISSFTEGAAITVSSITPTSFTESIIDGDEGTFWQSGGALPTGFLIRQDLNILLGLGGTSASSNSGGLPDSAITDGSVYTGLQITQVSGKPFRVIDLIEKFSTLNK